MKTFFKFLVPMLALLIATPAYAVVERTVKVSSNDTTASYLNNKLVAGTGVTKTENNDGGDETLTLSVSGFTADGAPEYLYIEGATDDSYEHIIGSVDPTADRTFLLPDDELAAGDVIVGLSAQHASYLNLATTQILIGDGSGAPTAASLSGDVTMTNAGVVTIAANSVDGTNIALGSDALGDIMYYDGTNWVRLARGSNGQFLSLASSIPTWDTPSGAGDITQVFGVSSGDASALTAASGDSLDMSSGDYSKPNVHATDCSGVTGEGRTCWDTDDNLLYIGDGASAVLIGPSSGGDSVSVNSSSTTDPDFVSTGDIAFTNTSNTITGDINTGVIVNADINGSAAIDVSKTALVDGTGLTLSTNTLNCDTPTTSAVGCVELTTTAEVDTGTDTSRAVTADALAGSNFGEKSVSIQVTAGTTNTATGDGQAYIVIPSSVAGMDLVEVSATVITAGTTGTTDIQIRNKTDSVDMLSTKMTIDSTETSTATAATPAVIDTTKDDVTTGDVLAVDVDAVSTTPAQGLVVTLVFRLP